MDLALFDPRLHSIEEINGVVYSTYQSNTIVRFEKIRVISEILRLVEGTLENLLNESLVKEQAILRKSKNRTAIVPDTHANAADDTRSHKRYAKSRIRSL